jgi:hypothetical protein
MCDRELWYVVPIMPAKLYKRWCEVPAFIKNYAKKKAGKWQRQ